MFDNKNIFIMFPFVFFLFLNASLAQGVSIQNAGETLKDFTPEEISANSVTVNPHGPLVIVCGLYRVDHQIDVRPDDQREKITLKSTDNQGYFIFMNDPSKKSMGESSTSPDDEGMAAVLFYPSEHAANQILISVSATENGNKIGNLNYSFNVGGVDEKEFSKIAEQNFGVEKSMLGFKHNESVKVYSDFYSKDGTSVARAQTVTSYLSKNADGSYERREGDRNGKLLETSNKARTIEEKYLFAGQSSPWGYAINGEAIYYSKPADVDPMISVWKFYFYNRKTFTCDGWCFLSSRVVNSNHSDYDQTGQIPFLQKQDDLTSYLWGGKVVENILEHQKVQ